MGYFFVLGIILFYGNSASAKEPSVTFFVKEQTVNSIGEVDADLQSKIKDLKTMKLVTVTQSDKAVEVPASEISRVIKEVKSEICNTIKTGEFKIWLKGEASGKLLGIGASSESGIEVSVKCETNCKKP